MSYQTTDVSRTRHDVAVVPEGAEIGGQKKSSAQPPMSDVARRSHEAIRLWLRWNEAYERVTAEMYQSGGDPRKTEELMDQMDQLRRQAIELSNEVLQ